MNRSTVHLLSADGWQRVADTTAAPHVTAYDEIEARRVLTVLKQAGMTEAMVGWRVGADAIPHIVIYEISHNTPDGAPLIGLNAAHRPILEAAGYTVRPLLLPEAAMVYEVYHAAPPADPPPVPPLPADTVAWLQAQLTTLQARVDELERAWLRARMPPPPGQEW